MNNTKDLLIKKFYGNGLSAAEISGETGLTLWQVYRSLKRQKIARRTRSLSNEIRFRKLPLSFSMKENLSSRDEILQVAALMLYSAEGAKTGSTVDLANSDIGIIKLFLKFLRKICCVKEDKLRCYLYCFSDQNAGELIEYWSKELRIKRDLFTKPYVRKVEGNHSRRMTKGVLHIRYNDKKLLEKILHLCSSVVADLIL